MTHSDRKAPYLGGVSPLDAFEEGVSTGWALALAWAGITPPETGHADE